MDKNERISREEYALFMFCNIYLKYPIKEYFIKETGEFIQENFNDMLYTYKKEEYIKSLIKNKDYIKYDNLIRVYIEFCKSNNIPFVNKEIFDNYLKEYYKVKVDNILIDGKETLVALGVTWKYDMSQTKNNIPRATK